MQTFKQIAKLGNKPYNVSTKEKWRAMIYDPAKTN